MTGLLSRPDLDVDAEIAEDLVCRRVVPVTHDVSSFVLESITGRRFGFAPGQYVTVSASVDGEHVERCYTISSAATRTDRLTITVKRIPGGPMSNWLHDSLAPGGRLRVTGPLGRFSHTEHPASKYLFLSAGSGITPLMSMTRTMLDEAPSDVVFVHSARSPRDIVFRTELDRIGSAGSGVRVTSVCEDDSPDERWDGPRGRLTLPLLRALAPDQLPMAGAVTEVGLPRGSRPVPLLPAALGGGALALVTVLAANVLPFWVLPLLVLVAGLALLLVPRRRHLGEAFLISVAVAMAVSLLTVAGSSRFPGSW